MSEMPRDYRNYLVWKKAYELGLLVYKFSKDFPNEEKYGLTSQLRRAGISVSLNIAEGCGRGSNEDFKRFLHIALGSLKETGCLLNFAKDLGFIDSVELPLSLCNEVERMLNSLILKL